MAHGGDAVEAVQREAVHPAIAGGLLQNGLPARLRRKKRTNSTFYSITDTTTGRVPFAA